ncbi:MAG: GDSL-type esterase/lipase family protein [Firmicutes bacterium]|nr:GDSL-type esterase/lipase family protein [Bacillota bacterium]
MKTNKKKSMFRSTVAAVSTLALLMLSMASCGSSDNGADSSQASSKVSSTAEVSSDLPASSEVSSVAKLPTSAAEADYTAKTLSAVENVDNIKMMGRYLKGASSLSFDATGSGILFNAYCEGDVSLNLTVSTSGNEDERFHSYYFTVYVDGKITQDRAKVTGERGKTVDVELSVATGLKKGLHKFEIYRQNENWLGNINFNSIKMNGQLAARPADNKVFIEFVGDSITAGYGNLYKAGDDAGSAMASQEYENGMKTYASLAAKALGVDWNIIAQGGARCSDTAAVYTKVSRNRDVEWNFERQPDVIVINLGTNDFGDNNYGASAMAEKKANVEKLLKLVREKNPNAKIVWAYGLMSSGGQKIKEVLESLGGEKSGYYFCTLPSNRDGGGAHPSVAGHEAASVVMADYLKKLIG